MLASLQEVAAGRSLRLALRPLIDAFSGSSQLADPDPNVRKAAATKMGNAGDRSALPALSEALGEGARALGAARHRGGHGADRPPRGGRGRARDRRRGRLGRIAQRQRARPAARRRRGARRAPGLKQAALEAVKRVERWGLLTSRPSRSIFQGVSLSSILLLMALGLAIVFGLMGVINMAHGELMALGAYATFVIQGWFAAHAPGAFDYYFLVALPVSFLVAGAAGFLLERGVIRFLYGRPLETLLLTWGVSLMIQQGLRLWFGAANVDVTSPKWLSGGIPVMVGAAAPVQPALHHRARHGLR